MNQVEITTTTLVCVFPLYGCHNGVKYQTKSPDKSRNLRQKLSLCFKIILEYTTSFHITVMHYTIYAYRRISLSLNAIITLELQSLNILSTFKGYADTISIKESLHQIVKETSFRSVQFLCMLFNPSSNFQFQGCYFTCCQCGWQVQICISM